MSHRASRPVKPKALHKGATLSLFSSASPASPEDLAAGIAELQRIGFRVNPPNAFKPVGYFAATSNERIEDFFGGLRKKDVDGLIAARGGYGTSHILEDKFNSRLQEAKCIVGFSDLTALQTFVWQVREWVTFYGPMAAAGFHAGDGKPGGYDMASFLQAVQTTHGGWSVPLHGETLVDGSAEGRIVGGCLTLLQTTIGTGWELDTRGKILVLEDRGMKPYQVDRALLHLAQAGKFHEVRGIVLGDFPDCDTPKEGGPSVRDVCEAILRSLGVPVIFGAPVGHTARAMLTLPLGVKAKLVGGGEGRLEILEAAVVE